MLFYFISNSHLIYCMIYLPGIPRRTAAGPSPCPPLATTRPKLQWRTPAWRRRLSEALLALYKSRRKRKMLDKGSHVTQLTGSKTLTVSWVVDNFGEAVRSVALHVKGLDLDLKLFDHEILFAGQEEGLSVDIAPRLGVRYGLVQPVVGIVRLEGHNVAKLFAVEVPRLHRLKGRGGGGGAKDQKYMSIGKFLVSSNLQAYLPST